MVLQKLRAFFQKGNCASWCAFLLFASFLLFKCVLYYWLCYHSIYISSLWRNPPAFFDFWLPKLAVSLFLASFVFVSKRQWWTIVVSLIADVWIIADLIYFRANDMHLTWNTIMMASNMQGFWSSVIAYTDNIVWFFLSTILFAILLLPIVNTRRSWKGFTLSMGLCLVSHCGGAVAMLADPTIHARHKLEYFIPFWTPDLGHDWDPSAGYIRQHSIIAYFPTMLIDKIRLLSEKDFGRVVYSEKEQHYLADVQQRYIASIENESPAPKNMIIILVESMESWAFEIDNVAPNLSALIGREHVFYADKIASQNLAGASGDGQMIVQTGLLPTQNGVACWLYGDNRYPNFAHFYEKSLLISPCGPSVWNQTAMTRSYEYKEAVYAGSKVTMDDAGMFCHVIDTCKSVSEMKNGMLLFALTIDTHTPFMHIPLHSTSLQLEQEMPEMMQRYLTCFHYMDSCFGAFWQEFEQSELFENTIVLITGDHTIFKSSQLRDFQSYAETHGLSIRNGKNYCPLIVYSPDIRETIRMEEECYQMDIYPTILNLIGEDSYYWQGLGVNLLDEKARMERSLSEEEAYVLSDKLIRTDWFATFSYPPHIHR